jgi:hypothetical protein
MIVLEEFQDVSIPRVFPEEFIHVLIEEWAREISFTPWDINEMDHTIQELILLKITEGVGSRSIALDFGLGNIPDVTE